MLLVTAKILRLQNGGRENIPNVEYFTILVVTQIVTFCIHLKKNVVVAELHFVLFVYLFCFLMDEAFNKLISENFSEEEERELKLIAQSEKMRQSIKDAISRYGFKENEDEGGDLRGYLGCK